MKTREEILAETRWRLEQMEAQVRASGKRVVPMTPEQQREHEQLTAELYAWTEKLLEPRQKTVRERLERAGVRVAFDMIWRSRVGGRP